jgi:hypothetical protein
MFCCSRSKPSLNDFNVHLKILKSEWALKKRTFPSLPPSPVLTYISTSNIKIHIYGLSENISNSKLSSIIEEFLNNMLDDGTVYNVYFDNSNYGFLECNNPYTNKTVDISESVLALLLDHEFTLPYNSSRFEVRFTYSKARNLHN